MIKDIKVKNSPLWASDPDQQLFYFASRSWARKWCPHVLGGVYTREELAANPRLGREETIEGDVVDGEALHHRLAAGNGDRTEGFQGNGHVEKELANIAAGSGAKQPSAGAAAGGGAAATETGSKDPAAGTPSGEPAKAGKGQAKKGGKRGQAEPKPDFDAETPVEKLATPAQYLKWWERRVDAARKAGMAPGFALEIYEAQDDVRQRLKVPVEMRLHIKDELIPSLADG